MATGPISTFLKALRFEPRVEPLAAQDPAPNDAANAPKPPTPPETRSEDSDLLFESSPPPSLVYDADTFALVAANRAAVRQSGYSREELLSMTLAILLVDEEPARHSSANAGDGAEIRKL